MIYRTLDLFSGIGGIRRGFELSGGFKNILSSEIDKYACKTYKHLFAEDPFNDATTEEFKIKTENTDYEVLLAGFPCQSFSIAGDKKGFKDKTRGTLFFDIADILSRSHPPAFLLENVAGLTSHKGGSTFKIILETLVSELEYTVIGVDSKKGKINYDPTDFILNSKNFGVPQNRPRVYIMGFRSDIINENKNYSLPKKREDLNLYKDINDLIEDRVEDKYYIPKGYLQTLKKHRSRHKNAGNGFGYVVVNKDKKEKISNAILATGGSGKERNIIYQPKKGVGGKKLKRKHTPLNDQGLRFMTPREWGKLQGFINYGFMDNGEDKFSFPQDVSETQQYKQFGNSVTIPVIETLANYLKNILDKYL